MDSDTKELVERLAKSNLRGITSSDIVCEIQSLREQLETEKDSDQRFYLVCRFNYLLNELDRRSRMNDTGIHVTNKEIIQTIKDRIPIDTVLSWYTDVFVHSGKWTYRCTLHGDDKYPSGVIYRDEDRFHCFACSAHGDIFDAVQLFERMELIEAIRSRYSVRAFKPDPVPRRILQELLEVSLRAPSWANTQPWECTVVGGEVMAELKKALVEKALSEAPTTSDLKPPIFSGRYLERSQEFGRRLFEVLGIGREDAKKRQEWALTGSRFFGAPNGIIVYIDRSLTAWSILDAGLFMQTLMLAAQNYGLGTCPMFRVVRHAADLRRILGIPESKLILCGLAIGYPDTDAPQNKFRTSRDPLETFVTWRGVSQ